MPLSSPRSVADALRLAIARLDQAGIENAGLDARLLLAAALGEPVEMLLLDRKKLVPTDRFEAMLARRVGREPLALILGRREFWSLEFEVSAATLIPRPDSETLIEAALAARRDVGRVLDLGTGTGCLLLAALSAYRAASGLGVDRVPAAIDLARRNAERLGLDARAAFVIGDWAAGLTGRFDLILCNPPYIPSAEIAGLMPEVATHEPASALDGGPDGLDSIRHLMTELPRLLAPGGLAIMEIGAGQGGSALALARAAGFACPSLRADLGGVPRALLLPTG